MTDYLNRFGGCAAAASAGTSVFDNVLDFGPIDPDAATRTHRTGEAPEETVVFGGNGAQATAVNLEHGDDTAAFTVLVSMPVSVTAAAGDFAFLPFPKSHKRYVRASMAAKAGTAAGAVSARIEAGASPREK